MYKKKLALYIIKFGLIPLGHIIIKCYLFFVRLEVINEQMIRDHLRRGEKVIAAIWHQRFFGVINYAGRFNEYEPSAIISKSRDGDLIAGLAQRLHYRPIRGSSSRGGKEALAAMIADLKINSFAVHAVDGPTGPLGLVKPGLIRMAQLSGAPIVPVYISMNRAWHLRSWDRFMIPKPFSTVMVRWDDPIYIQKELDQKTFENTRLKVEKHIREGQEQDDLRWGCKGLLSP
jgi:lysophospholipid acyltransferase (LPLAT)-like uncharacterized protein